MAYSCFSFKKRCFCSRAFVFRQTSSRGNHVFLGFFEEGSMKKLVVLKLVRKCTPLTENDSCILINS